MCDSWKIECLCQNIEYGKYIRCKFDNLYHFVWIECGNKSNKNDKTNVKEEESSKNGKSTNNSMIKRQTQTHLYRFGTVI